MSQENLFSRSLFAVLEVLKASGSKQISIVQVNEEAERMALLKELVTQAGLFNSYQEYLRSLLVESAGPAGFNFRQETFDDCCQAVLKATESFWIDKRLAKKYGLKPEKHTAIL
jgi:hypothetical protein